MKHFTTSIPIEGGRRRLPIQFEGVLRESLSANLVGDLILSIATPEGHSLSKVWYAQVEMSSGKAVEFTASSTEVEGWVEYGTINVGLMHARTPVAKPLITAAIKEFVIKAVELLVAEEENYQIEAGLVITAEDGRELVVVAGDIPGAFSVRLPGEKNELDPQFPWQDYLRLILD